MYSTEAWGKLSKEANFSKFQIQRNVPGDDDVQFEVHQDTLWKYAWIKQLAFLLKCPSTKWYSKYIVYHNWSPLLNDGCGLGEILWHLPHWCSLRREDFGYIEGITLNLFSSCANFFQCPLYDMLQYHFGYFLESLTDWPHFQMLRLIVSKVAAKLSSY